MRVKTIHASKLNDLKSNIENLLEGSIRANLAIATKRTDIIREGKVNVFF